MKSAAIYICLLLCCFHAHAQLDLKKQVNTDPPNVASFEKYGNTPINYSTGQLDQSIPLYTLMIDENVSVPIDLRYSNIGMKPSQVPTWVGHGWDLMPGGYIVQEIRGVNDFFPVGMRDASVRQGLLDYMGGNMPDPATRYNYIRRALQGNIDTQQDIFSLNIMSQSAKFFFDGTDVKFIKYTPYKVQYDPVTGFTVTDEKGYKYIFGRSVFGSGSIDNDPYEFPSLGGSVTWYLTKIVTPYNDEATFEYDQDVNYITTISNGYYTWGAQSADAVQCFYGFSGPEQSQSSSSVVQIVPKRITFKGRKIDFLTIPRNDLKSQDNTPAKALSVLQVTNEQNQLVKKISFSYTNTTRLKLDSLTILDNVSGQAIQRYKFAYYQNQGTDLTNIPLITSPNRTFAYDYWGFYNGATANTFKGVPMADYSKMLSGLTSFKGANDRDADSASSRIGMLQRITYPTGGYTEMEYESNKMIYPTLNSIPDFLRRKVDGTLQTVAYANVHCPGPSQTTGNFTLAGPINAVLTWEFFTDDPSQLSAITIKNLTTGEEIYRIGDTNAGTDQFRLEAGPYQYTLQAPCSFAEEGSPNYAFFDLSQFITPVSIPVQTGGNRLLRIKDFDPVAGKTTIRRLAYEEPELNEVPYFITTRRLMTTAEPQTNPASLDCGLQYIIGATNQVTFDGPHMDYRKVTEYMGENGENGKNVYTYDSQRFVSGDYTQAPFPPITNFSGRSSALLKQETYRKNGTADMLQQETSIDYTPSPGPSIFDFIQGVKFAVSGQVIIGQEIPGDYNKYYTSAQIYLPTDKFKQSSVNSIEHGDDNSTLTKQIDYTYNDPYFLPYKTVETNSMGKSVEKYTWYAGDFNNGVANVQTLKNNNMIGLPLKTSTSVAGKIVKGEIFTRDDKGNIANVYEYENDLMPAMPAHDPATYIAQGFKQRNALTYNTNNRLTEFKKDDDAATILWGYNSTYPVAEITNATYQEVLTVLGQTVIDQLASANPGTDAQVRTALNVLRTDARLKKAIVKTFTYNPLVGMTSQTDPMGIITFYEYDGAGRLKRTKDKDGKILKQYDYQYQQPVNQ
ncbi:RHS repeat protein [Chitinophaga agrisoli]|uniref:RHS repeat protein n=1 Tax=Chitinophaga agrisoli TaxID=2607653 RepID=A0A5B2VVS1_9BACT|nr:RHS repeat domain-containing protein [Chitinophaga agrisoli]KAA2242668.1 RHS repeat protein [Chitinophaga agrisoli]